MSEDKKSKKNGIEKLRKVLDDIYYKDLDSKDEKHIIALKSRLKGPSELEIIYKKTVETVEEADSLKPTVIIHERKEKRLVDYLETAKKEVEPVKESTESLPEFKVAKKSQIEDEDIFEVQKVDVKVLEFIEVKPKTVIEEDTSDLDKKSAIAGEKVAEWEQIKEEDIPSFTAVEKKVEEEKVFEEVLKKEEIVAPKEVDLERDKKIETFKELHSIDEETAVLLYNAGYTSIDLLKLTTVKDLSKIKGIKKKKAKKILKEIEEESVKSEAIDAEQTTEKKIIEGETKLEEEVISKDVKIEVFGQINCIDNETAILLYDNGYTSFDLLKNVKVDDLRKIDGIRKRKAKKIRKELDEKIEDLDKLKRIEMGDTTQNWVSDKEEMLDENEIYDEESVKTSPVDLSKKTSEWIPLEEEVDLERDKKIEIFKELHSIDEETAVLLYNAGYTSIDALCAATIKDLTEVNGIKKRKAKKILKEIEKKLLPPIEEETFEEYETEEPEEKIEEYKEPIIEEEETIEQQEKIQIFDDFNSIDEETGTILYNNGYTTIESLKELTIKTLKDIGVKKRKAKKIFKEIEKKLLPPIEEETFEEYETEGPEEKIEEYKEPIIEEERTNNRRGRIY
ncbi:MAG: hypothetical protein BV457_05460 [Thermoplasmata archaeon M9B1D]|nr:MAG: hypothetical protein BV457_05460 [Thermoplasmata archaeon M9B1D]